MKYLIIILCFLIILTSSCTKEENLSNKDETLLYESEDIEEIKPYKFYLNDNNGDTIIYLPSFIEYDFYNNNLIVLDNINYQVLILSNKGELIRKFGYKGEAVGELINPLDIGFDQNGNIYILDNKKIKIFDSLGNEIKSFVVKGFPWKIRVIDSNNIYVISCMPINNKILFKYDSEGNILGEYIEAMEKNNPNPFLQILANQSYITNDKEGNIYIAFANEYKIIKISENGNIDYKYILSEVPYEVIKPHRRRHENDTIMSIVIADITTDCDGNLYVLWGEDLGEPYCRVDKYSQEGEFIGILKLSVPSPGEGLIKTLTNIEVYSNYLFASEQYNDGLIYRYEI